MADQYFCFVEALPYIFVRNFEHRAIIHRISLSRPQAYPTSMKLFDCQKLKVDEDSLMKEKGLIATTSGNFLVGVGTKDGGVLIYRYPAHTTAKAQLLFASKKGTAFGAITALEISRGGEHLLAGTEKGEVHHWDLKTEFNK